MLRYGPTNALLDTVALPNYTGGGGFGEKYIRKLPGQCGRLDVDDCMESIRYLIKKGITEEDKQHLFGGSHGGFIVAHRGSLSYVAFATANCAHASDRTVS